MSRLELPGKRTILSPARGIRGVSSADVLQSTLFPLVLNIILQRTVQRLLAHELFRGETSDGEIFGHNRLRSQCLQVQPVTC